MSLSLVEVRSPTHPPHIETYQIVRETKYCGPIVTR